MEADSVTMFMLVEAGTAGLLLVVAVAASCLWRKRT